jgi:hypothetical protein
MTEVIRMAVFLTPGQTQILTAVRGTAAEMHPIRLMLAMTLARMRALMQVGMRVHVHS